MGFPKDDLKAAVSTLEAAVNSLPATEPIKEEAQSAVKAAKAVAEKQG